MTKNPGAVADPDLEPVLVTASEVVIDGRLTRYWVWGEADAATTVLAVHGFRGDHHGLLPIVARLDGVRVITPDLPGYGSSEPFAGPEISAHDVEGYATWLAAFCSALELGDSAEPEQLILLGHSFGSVICAAAVASGLKPDRLVLINPIAAPPLSGPRAIMSGAAVGYYRLGAALPERFGEALLASRAVVRLVTRLTTTTDDPRLRRWIRDQHDRYFSGYADRRVVLESFTASVSHHIGEYAAALSVPTLLIAGDQDDVAPIAAQRRLAPAITDARLEELPGVGHLIHYERPDQAAELIMNFVGR